MEATERLHGLDAVRAIALLLGLVLHGLMGFVAEFPMAIWRDAQSSPVAAVLFYVIHMFRMAAFFVVAGFFARVMVERRGTRAFIKDRARRIAMPLFLFGPFVLVSLVLGVVLGALMHGPEQVRALGRVPLLPDPSAVALAGGGGIPVFAHLWFLYYLLIFYALALALRAVIAGVDKHGRLAAVSDRVVRFLMRGVWGTVLIALPLAAWLTGYAQWGEWTGLPGPQSLIPDPTSVLGYGLAFGIGWLLQRQQQLLLDLGRSSQLYFAGAVLMTLACFALIGVTPTWSAGNLAGAERAAYALAYVAGQWCWIFALIGVSLRYLSAANPVVRYLADASYWIYLMHGTTLGFFVLLLQPYGWHWSLKFVLSVGASLPLLLASYHYWVRFTWLGAVLNGRRQPPADHVAETRN